MTWPWSGSVIQAIVSRDSVEAGEELVAFLGRQILDAMRPLGAATGNTVELLGCQKDELALTAFGDV